MEATGQIRSEIKCINRFISGGYGRTPTETETQSGLNFGIKKTTHKALKTDVKEFY